MFDHDHQCEVTRRDLDDLRYELSQLRYRVEDQDRTIQELRREIRRKADRADGEDY